MSNSKASKAASQSSELRERLLSYCSEYGGVAYFNPLPVIQMRVEKLEDFIASEKDRLIDELISELPEKDVRDGILDTAQDYAMGYNQAVHDVTQLLLEYREAQS